MLHSKLTASAKRRAFREHLASGELLRFPGAFNPLSAQLIERKGFEGVYISGAVLSADLGLPDIGLTTLTEVAARGAQIARVTDLPTLIDAAVARLDRVYGGTGDPTVLISLATRDLIQLTGGTVASITRESLKCKR